MGWYHCHQLLQGLVPNGYLARVVEPFYMSCASECDAAGRAAFDAFRAKASENGVEFFPSVEALLNQPKKAPPAGDAPPSELALVACRAVDSPSMVSALLSGSGGSETSGNFGRIYLEKPGATSVDLLQSIADAGTSNGVPISMGYNKNVTNYVTDALKALTSSTDGSGEGDGETHNITFTHHNAFQESGLPECFERNAEGMLKNMAIHELALLATYFDVTAANITEASVQLNRDASKCLTLQGPSSKADFTDFQRISFGLSTVWSGKRVGLRVNADRCAGSTSSASVSVTSGDDERELFVSSTPDEATLAQVKMLQTADAALLGPDVPVMPYFHLQHDDYITLKERCCAAVLSGDTSELQGVPSIRVGIEALKIAEALEPLLKRQLSS